MNLMKHQLKWFRMMITVSNDYFRIVFMQCYLQLFIAFYGINISPVNDYFYFKQAEYPAFFHCKNDMILTGNNFLFK